MPEHKTNPFGGSTCLTERSSLLISPVAAVPVVAQCYASPVAAELVEAQCSASLLVVAELAEAQCSASPVVAVLAACTKPSINKFGN
jgi:hypothetical protein